MAKSRNVESKLARLRLLRDEPLSPENIEVVRASLADGSNLVIAAAAVIVGDRAVSDLAADLTAGFERLMAEPEENDKQCRGKIAIAEALNKIEHPHPEVFLRGFSHVQEPTFGKPEEDAAGPLRAHCAFGLTRINYPKVILLLTELLRDSDRTARVGAARALGWTNSQAAVPLLRFKAHLGDKDPEVIGECFTALLSIAPAESLPFVADFLRQHSEPVRQAAVFAIAETRRPEAFAVLKDFWPKTPEDLQEAVLLAMATFRTPAALEFLTEIIAGKKKCARAAISALRIHRHDSKIKQSIDAAVTANGDPAIRQWFEKKFAPETL